MSPLEACELIVKALGPLDLGDQHQRVYFAYLAARVALGQTDLEPRLEALREDLGL